MSKQVQGVLTLMVVVVAGWLGGCLLIPLFTGEGTPANPAPVATGDPYVDDLQHLSWLLREKWSWLEMREAQGLDLETVLELFLRNDLAFEQDRSEPGVFHRRADLVVAGSVPAIDRTGPSA